MKKIACFTLAALALMACQREVDNPQEYSVPTYPVTITARLEATRTAYDDAGKFSWVAGDKINVLITNGTTSKQVAFTTAEAGVEVQFTGQVDEGFQVGAEAAYALDFDAAKKAWILPEQMTVNPLSPLSCLPLFGAEDNGGLFQFKTATGILKFTVENVPVETAAVTLETVGDEAPALCGELAAAPADGVVTMAALANGGKKLVSAGAPGEPNTTKDYYFFVPAGTLPAEKTQFNVVDGSDHVIKSFAFKKPVEVAANRVTNVAPVHFEAVKITNRQTDSLALVAIFKATGGAQNWHADRVWDLTQPIDKWYNVKLDEAGRVTQVNLANGTVTAPWTLPAAVGDLTEMTNFRIIGCQLTGAIPEEIYNLTKLVSFYLTKNTPTWTLSAKIAGMTDLKDLYIDQNANLTGPLPKELGQLKKLVNINVAQTGISGSIPAEMSGCSSLANLMAYKTQLTGIPDNFDEWPALKMIQLYGIPGLTGPLPASVGRCTKVTSVWFYECNFTGNIPESWANLPASCTQLRIQDNKLQGVVPAAIQAHANFKEKWNPAKYILPQQEGYGLTLHAGSGGQDLDNPVDTDPWN